MTDDTDAAVPFFRRIGDLLLSLLTLAVGALVAAVISFQSDIAVLINNTAHDERRWESQTKFNDSIAARLTTGGCNAARCAAHETAIDKISRQLEGHEKTWAHHGAAERHAVAAEKRAALQSDIADNSHRTSQLEAMLPNFFNTD